MYKRPQGASHTAYGMQYINKDLRQLETETYAEAKAEATDTWQTLQTARDDTETWLTSQPT